MSSRENSASLFFTFAVMTYIHEGDKLNKIIYILNCLIIS
ncbi:hypothetical protein CSC17_2227 [Klebsiella oxytoca]|nr:hypothetical protein CSC17_2227 [Klebsiella oxytoca]